LDLPLFFTQTGQLSLEQALQSFPGVCTIIHSGRDEEFEEERHLRQFRLTEEEFDCTMVGMTREKYDEEKMFVALLAHMEGTIKAMIKQIVKENGELLEKVYRRKVADLEKVLKSKFLRIAYEDVVKLLVKNGFKKLVFGDDLEAEHEEKVVELLSKGKVKLPVFITLYPKDIKFFNMKVSEKDERVVLSSDLILPFSGESVGSAVREHNFERLNQRLLTSKLYELHVKRGGKYEDFKWYLDIMKSGKTQPHAGYGVGNDRVLQFVFGTSDIRTVSLFSLLNRQTGDWDKKRYGQAAILGSSKKQILLSVGQMRNKKFLLPSIEKLSKDPKFVLHATEKTYKFLNSKGVRVSLVHKITEVGKMPNIADLLARRVFDLIVNIPTKQKLGKSNEFTDGRLIRKGAVDMGVTLVTDPEVALATIANLAEGI
jgi:asparaginyl-tRNA synthetase